VTISSTDQRGELGDFLRRRREALTPAAAGIVADDRRRTPGLRREEVAELAHMSMVYYERLERGRGPMPSAAMLAGLARALQLTDDQREHLYHLVGQAPPPAPEPAGHVDPGLAAALSMIAPAYPASIADELGTILAQNRMSALLLGRMAGANGPAANMIWRWFTDADWRHLQEPVEQHEETGRAFVADLRRAVTRRGRDPRSRALVSELREASAEFADKWDEHVVSSLHCSAKRIDHERVGTIELECSVLLSPLSAQRLLVLRPEPGSASEGRLTRIVDTWSETSRPT
jgi:transcriptional regulator with XRE-family HTH domain